MGALQRSKGGVRTTPPVLQSLSKSAFKLYEGRRGGARILCAPLPKEAEALSATCGRPVRFLLATRPLPPRDPSASFGISILLSSYMRKSTF